MKTQPKTGPLPPEARALQRRIVAWRGRRLSGAPMPEVLWNEAAVLARKHGAYTIARGLPVDYGALKRRVESAAVGNTTKVAVRAAFVEVTPAQFVGGMEGAGVVVELARPDGARMVVRLPVGMPLDLGRLVATFCGGEA